MILSTMTSRIWIVSIRIMIYMGLAVSLYGKKNSSVGAVTLAKKQQLLFMSTY
jgi:hypothetical protein